MTKTEYAKYLNTDHWREKRKEAMAGGASSCARCALPRWLAEIAYDQDLHVHHKTYANLGNESVEDLETLCRRCHEVETFGRSELRAPKMANCSICCYSHWDYRSDLCIACEAFFVEHRFEEFIGYNAVIEGESRPVWSVYADALVTLSRNSPISLKQILLRIGEAHVAGLNGPDFEKLYSEFEAGIDLIDSLKTEYPPYEES